MSRHCSTGSTRLSLGEGKQVECTLPLFKLNAWRHFAGKGQGQEELKKPLEVLLHLDQRLGALSWLEFMRQNNKESKLCKDRALMICRGNLLNHRLNADLCRQRMKLQEAGERPTGKKTKHFWILYRDGNILLSH